MPAPKQHDAKVISQPRIHENSLGVLTGMITLKSDDFENSINCFFDDPHDLKLFSFQVGDEVKATVKESKGFLNGTIKTAAGSVEDPEDALAKAKAAYELVNKYDDKMGMLMGIYTHAKETVLASEDFIKTISHLNNDDEADIYEENIRAATASIFIEFNRKGYGLGDIVPFTD